MMLSDAIIMWLRGTRPSMAGVCRYVQRQEEVVVVVIVVVVVVDDDDDDDAWVVAAGY
jgi:hypothetical protein